MKAVHFYCSLLLVLLSLHVSAAVRYVNLNNPGPSAPYASWTTAATNIQDAIDAAANGDLILVTNGVYQTGAQTMDGSTTNRVCVTRPLTLRGVNGSAATVIDGGGVMRCLYLTNSVLVEGFTLTNGAIADGGGAVFSESTNSILAECVVIGSTAYYAGGVWQATLTNCMLLANSAGTGGGAAGCVLKHCTLADNYAGYGGGRGAGADSSILEDCVLTNNYGGGYGGGGASSSVLNRCTISGNTGVSGGGGALGCTLNNCFISQNYAYEGAGGVDGCVVNNCIISGNGNSGATGSTLNNCAITGNSGSTGGGAINSVLNHCTLTLNTASAGGGASFCTLSNCIVYDNTAADGANYSGGVFYFSCTTPLPSGSNNNFTNAPQLTDAFHISATSPCIGAARTNSAIEKDIDGENWLNPPTVGCDEFYSSAIAGDLVVGVSAAYTNFAANFAVTFTGSINGHASSNVWNFGEGAQAVNQLSIAHAWSSAGDYPVTWTAYNESHPGGVSATVMVHVGEGTYYVNWNNATPAAPFTSWTTAATNIQDAVDVAALGGLVLVTNGIYKTGGHPVYALTQSNRVAVTKPLTVRSVNGPADTVIEGYHDPVTLLDFGSIRCVYLTNFATLSGFTVTNGGSQPGNDQDGREQIGGGVWCESRSATVSNCVITGCAAEAGGGINGGTIINSTLTNNFGHYVGGGAEGCVADHCLFIHNQALADGYAAGGAADSSTLNRCTLTGNSSDYAGGAANSTLTGCALYENLSGSTAGGAANSALNHCTLTGNAAVTGGGVDSCTLSNSIAYYNTAAIGANYSSSTLNFCCTIPLPADGSNNITSAPQLTDASHLSSISPCIGAGSTDFLSGTDIDGENWLNPPSIGCDEFYIAAPGGLALSISANYTNVATGFAVALYGNINGHASSNVWNFGDGSFAFNQLSVMHAWSLVGDYPVVLTAYNDSHPGGVSATVTVHVIEGMYYVDQNNVNPAAPFTAWATAATNIQAAIDAAVVGGTVIVSNGIYNVGGRVVFGTMTNRVVVDKPITVRSVNGPLVTAIQGNNDSAVRCVYLTNGAALMGFTLTNGSTRGEGDWDREVSGGGVWCESAQAFITNCVFTGNTAPNVGGGVYGGTLVDCIFTNNSSSAGGGAYGSVLNNCQFWNNSAGYSGGAVHNSTLMDCTLTGNTGIWGGGAYGSTLINCALSGNSTHDDSDHTSNGGGASGSTLTNCIISENASLTGGGVGSSTLVNCTVNGNQSFGNGGGVSGSTLVNCMVVGNVAGNVGGGINSSTATNCIVYFNTASGETNYSADSTLVYCDTTPLPALGGNNITSNPLLADLKHISLASPCRSAGIAAAAVGVDIDGDVWLNPPAIGCDEFDSSSATGALAVAASATFTNVATGFTSDFTGQISGHATANRWDFGDGTIVSNQVFISHSWAAAGNYPVTLTVFNTDHPAGVSASVTIFVLQNPVHYVALDNASPMPPYTSWATAATNIQNAVDAAFANGTVIVSNGVYQTGLRMLGTTTNRVVVAKPLAIQSVNGADVTIIDGGHAMRCLHLASPVSVSGLTLRNGTQANGAGVYCQSSADILSDCILSGNSSSSDYSVGGGALGGVLNRCLLAGNSASYGGGGMAYSTLNFCVVSNNSLAVYGGGTYGGTVNNCLVISNSAGWGGGCIGIATINNSVIVGNSASSGGGGVNYATLNNCTVIGNSAPNAAGVDYGSTARNCIVYYNNGPNYDAYVQLDYCCTTPNPGGAVNFTNAPMFVNLAGGDFRLQPNSLCINSGNNGFVSGANDFAGLDRVSGGTVDAGAYEFQSPSSTLSYAWAQQYGLPTDGSADNTDSDGDGMNNWAESHTRTDPTNAASVLRLLPPVIDSNLVGATVAWESIAGVSYFLQRGTNLTSPAAFSTILDNINGQADVTAWQDETTTDNGPFFYRVGVH